jgi:hypothetical protein
MNNHVKALLSAELSRKEFLTLSVLALGSVLGLGTIIKLLTGKSLSGKQLSIGTPGYGRNDYGK